MQMEAKIRGLLLCGEINADSTRTEWNHSPFRLLAAPLFLKTESHRDRAFLTRRLVVNRYGPAVTKPVRYTRVAGRADYCHLNMLASAASLLHFRRQNPLQAAS